MARGYQQRMKFDYEQVKSLAARGLNQEQIALALGVSPRTVTRRIADDQKFADAMRSGRAKGCVVVTNALFEQVKNGNMTAIIWYTRNMMGWSEDNALRERIARLEAFVEEMSSGRNSDTAQTD